MVIIEGIIVIGINYLTVKSESDELSKSLGTEPNYIIHYTILEVWMGTLEIFPYIYYALWLYRLD